MRKWGHDIHDLLYGRPVARACQELSYCWSSSDDYDLKDAKLYALLRHATNNCEAYRSMSGFTSIEDFPLTSKRALRDQFDSYRAWGVVSIKSTFSSGSYGAPLELPMSAEKVARRSAEAIIFNGTAGYCLGMRFATVTSLVHWHKNRLQKILRNEKVIRVHTMSEAELADAFHKIRADGIEFVIGHPSVLAAISRYGQALDLRVIGCRGVVCYGESLGKADRMVISEVFGCSVYERYASNELGIVMHDYIGHSSLRVNNCHYKVELLHPENDEPALPGSIARIVVTDLYSHVLPLIRFDTGDLAILSKGSDRSGLISRVAGREIEALYDTSGRVVFPVAVLDAMRNSQMRLLRQFQILQTYPDTYIARVLPYENFDAEVIASDLRAVFGAEAKVIVECVPDIEQLPSGKRAVAVNLVKRT